MVKTRIKHREFSAWCRAEVDRSEGWNGHCDYDRSPLEYIWAPTWKRVPALEKMTHTFPKHLRGLIYSWQSSVRSHSFVKGSLCDPALCRDNKTRPCTLNVSVSAHKMYVCDIFMLVSDQRQMLNYQTCNERYVQATFVSVFLGLLNWRWFLHQNLSIWSLFLLYFAHL